MDTSVPCGLKNHGNTCFMNAIIQCLSNTDLIAEYFVAGHYLIDFKKQNKLNCRSYGTRGELTEQLAILLKSLWTNKYHPDISCKFKNIVSKFGSQYQGSDQHDAQEFLLWLLDKVHEDVNVACKKKSKKAKNLYIISRSDEEIAAESLANHVRMNRSFIHDLIQGQLKSSLVCRSCGKESNTFDPYLCLSLPVPTRQMHTIIVNIVHLNNDPHEVKIAVSIESQATLRELRDKISRLIRIPEKNLVLLLLDNENGLRELVNDGQIVQEFLDDLQEIRAVQTPPLKTNTTTRSSNASAPSSPNSPGEPLNLVLVNRVGSGSQGTLFGPLFSLQVSRESSFKEIQSQILAAIQPIIKENVDLNIAKESILFRLRVIGGLPGKNYLPEDVDHPLYMPTVDRAISYTEDKDYRGPLHLMLVVEWDRELRQSILLADADIPQPVVDKEVEYVKERSLKVNHVTLSDCLDLYFKEERLGAENAWMCPGCKRRQQCVKKLSLWSMPDVFVIHLKRFRLTSTAQRSKTTTYVEFPISSLDMTPYITPRSKSSHLRNGFTRDDQFLARDSSLRCSSETLPSLWNHHPWQRPSLRCRKMSPKADDYSTYDLYAVCNHLGNMQSGHYTAYCKSPVDGRWFSYDDTKVTEINEKNVLTSDAYILFYQRASLVPSSASSSSSGYSSSTSHVSNDVHWSLRLSTDHLKCNEEEEWNGLRNGELRRSRGSVRDTDHWNRQGRGYSTLPASSRTARKLYQLFFRSSRPDHPEPIRRRSPSPVSRRSLSTSNKSQAESNGVFASQMRVILPEPKPPLLVDVSTNSHPPSPQKTALPAVENDVMHHSPTGGSGDLNGTLSKKQWSVTSV